LLQLHLLAQLMKLDIRVHSEEAAAALLQGASSESGTGLMQAALPASVRALSVAAFLNSRGRIPDDKFKPLIQTFLAAAAAMPQLTEFTLRHKSRWDGMRLDGLVALPLLRKLSLVTFAPSGIPLSGLKAMSQLRELSLGHVESEELLSLFQPPHSLQLEVLRMESEILEDDMRSLVSVPTLTELQSLGMESNVWPLLPQLPILRRLMVIPVSGLTAARTTSLSNALSHCTALVDLTLCIDFADEEDVLDQPNERRRARWTALLQSVPHIRRLGVHTTDASGIQPLFAVLPAHLPRLEQLALFSSNGGVELLTTQLAHPTLQLLELRAADYQQFSEEQISALLHSPRLPQLHRCQVAYDLFASLHSFNCSSDFYRSYGINSLL
jgi:hypothetical protein